MPRSACVALLLALSVRAIAGEPFEIDSPRPSPPPRDVDAVDIVWTRAGPVEIRVVPGERRCELSAPEPKNELDRPAFVALGRAAADCLIHDYPPARGPRLGKSVVWHPVKDPHATCEKLTHEKSIFKILGCSQWMKRPCRIYARPPHDENDAALYLTLGHELMHCFDGNWHDAWGRMLPKDQRR